MKHTKFLAALVVGLSLAATGCGTSDYVQTVQLSPAGTSGSGGTYNLVGIDGNLQLAVNAIYHSGKSVPVTQSSTYSVTINGADATGQALPPYGPNTVPINSNGLMTAVVSLCTWTDTGTPLPTPPKYNWLYTGYYQVTATYKGIISQPIAIGVGSASGNAPDGSCGPA